MDDYLGRGVEKDARQLRRVVAGRRRGCVWRRVALTETHQAHVRSTIPPVTFAYFPH